MKIKFLLPAALCLSLSGFAQTDTTIKTAPVDTIRIGNMLIIKSGKNDNNSTEIVVKEHHFHNYNERNIRTNWLIVDLGFANYNDKTNYASAPAQQMAPGGTSDWFKLRTGKSIDVNIWLFIQRLNLIQHVVNLKYGLGIEL